MALHSAFFAHLDLFAKQRAASAIRKFHQSLIDRNFSVVITSPPPEYHYSNEQWNEL